MTNKEFEIILMAAGKGTRMKSALPKVLHRICGKTMVRLVVEALGEVPHKQIICVVGHGKELVETEIKSWDTRFSEKIRFAHQKEQKGTGDAIRVAFAEISTTQNPIFILSGDTPMVSGKSLQNLWQQFQKTNADMVVGAMKPQNPFGYGRIIGGNGRLERIVEEKEASEEEKKNPLVNGGIYIVSPEFLRNNLSKLKASSTTGEIYLTDLIHLGTESGKTISYLELDAKELEGVNDLEQLADVANLVRRRRSREWMKHGVHVVDPRHIYMDLTVEVEAGAVIEPNVYLYGNTKISSGAHIESGSRLENVILEKNVRIKAHSYLEDCAVTEGAVVGPMARIRIGTTIGRDAKIGNFVELKKAVVGEGVKVSHLSYVGDAEIGEGSNIGCGFITCNYDGISKHKTVIGSNVFVGSDVQAVAPVVIESDSYIASGSTITKHVRSGDLAIARVRQENKVGYAKRILSMKKKK